MSTQPRYQGHAPYNPTQSFPPGRTSPQRVHFPGDDPAATARGRRVSRSPSSDGYSSDERSPSRTRARSRSRARTVSRSRSRSRSRRAHDRHRRVSPDIAKPSKEEKPWYRKKTMWSGLATIATVAALVPSAVSANASRHAADASGRAARASEKSAHQVKKSAKASQQSASAATVSARAVTAASIGQGHMDHHGRYVKKVEPQRKLAY